MSGHVRDGVTLVTALGAAALFLLYAGTEGFAPLSAAAGGAAILFTQVLPGALVWRTVRPRQGWLVEDFAMGFALGTALAVPAQVAAGLSRLHWLSAAVPLAVGAVLLLVPGTRARILSARTTTLPWWWGPLVGAAALPAIHQLISYFTIHPLRWPPGTWAPHTDVYLHQALAAQLYHRGPVAWPAVIDEDLGYHWFTHAWIAQTARVSGTGVDEVLLRLMPAVMPSLVVLAAAVGGLRLARRPVAGVLAAALTMVGGHLNVFGTSATALPIPFPLTPLSPTMAMGVPTLVGLVITLTVRWRGEARPGAVALVPVFAVVAAGTKGSTSPLVVAGLAVAAVAMAVWNRRQLRVVLVDLGLVASSLALTMAVVFHGSTAGLAFGIPDAANETPLSTWLQGVPDLGLQYLAVVFTALSILSRSAAVFALPLSRAGRRDPLTWLLIGGSLAGAGGAVVFSHPGRSQYYFGGTSMPLMAIGATLGLLALAERLGSRSLVRVAVLGIVGGVLLVRLPSVMEGSLVPHAHGQTWRMLGWAALVALATALCGAWAATARSRVVAGAASAALASTVAGILVFVGILSTSPQRGPVAVKWNEARATTRAQVDAGRWIRDHSGVDDLVMTNRHCTTTRHPAGGCDSRRWVVSASTERQVLVEGWTATPKATELVPRGRGSITVDFWRPELLELNDGFIATPTDQAAEELRELGVRWVFADHSRPHAETLEPHATLRYSNRGVDVYEFEPADG